MRPWEPTSCPRLPQRTEEVLNKCLLISSGVLWKFSWGALCGIQTILNKGLVISYQEARSWKQKIIVPVFYSPKVSHKLMKAKSLNSLVPLSL